MYQSFNCILQNASIMIIHILALAIIEGLRLRKAYARISLRIYNLLGIRLPTLFVLKNVRVFSTNGQTRNTSVKIPPPPPPLPSHPSSNSVKHTRTVFWLSRIDTDGGGGMGGGVGGGFALYYTYFLAS